MIIDLRIIMVMMMAMMDVITIMQTLLIKSH